MSFYIIVGFLGLVGIAASTFAACVTIADYRRHRWLASFERDEDPKPKPGEKWVVEVWHERRIVEIESAGQLGVRVVTNHYLDSHYYDLWDFVCKLPEAPHV